MLKSFRGPPRRQILGPPQGGRSPAEAPPMSPVASGELIITELSWGFLGAFARPRNHSFPARKLTFRAKMTVWETHTSRAIKTVLEICQQLPRTKAELFELLENSLRRRGLLSNIRKNSTMGAPKLERELRKSLKSADSSSGSEGRWPKTRTPARFAL